MFNPSLQTMGSELHLDSASECFEILDRSTMKYLASLLLAVVFLRCNSNTKEYYPSGTLKKESKRINDSVDFVINYFEGGTIKSQGQFINGMPEGNWIEYNQSQEVKWKGVYEYGIRKYADKDHVIDLIFDKDSKTFARGVGRNMQVLVENIHPEDIAVATTNGDIKLSNMDLGKYTLTPEKEGELTLIIYTTYSGLKEIKRIKYQVY